MEDGKPTEPLAAVLWSAHSLSMNARALIPTQTRSTCISEVPCSGHHDAVPSPQLQEGAQTGTVKLDVTQVLVVDSPLHPSHNMTQDRQM